MKTSKSVMARRLVVGAETYLSRSVRIERGDLGGGGCSTIWPSSAYMLTEVAGYVLGLSSTTLKFVCLSKGETSEMPTCDLNTRCSDWRGSNDGNGSGTAISEQPPIGN